MSAGKILKFVFVLCMLASLAPAQPKVVPVGQTPRQAILEMLTGGEDKFKKHLTIEVQQKIEEMARVSSSNSTAPVNPEQLLTMIKSTDGSKFDTFETGRILFAVNNTAKHERFEVHLVGEEQHGSQDDMELSIHSFRSGTEEPMPVVLRFLVSMKLQETVWRLDALTVSVRLPVGDPRIFDKSFWSQSALASANANSLPLADPVVSEVPGMKMTPMRAVRMITLAENLYAQKHPGVGFTCSLPSLVNVGKGIDDGETYTFMAPEFSSGVYNGYKFTIQGCSGTPVKAFQVIAEPVNGKGKTYCSDHRQNLRWADDSQGATCLSSGTLARQ
jgi:hypothetical protein